MSVTRIIDTDDDGSGLVGTPHGNAWLQSLQDVMDARWTIKVITLTGAQNNLSLADTNNRDADFIIFNNATDLTISGMAAPASPAKPGKILRYVCIGAGAVYFKHQSASSSSANRFWNFATSGDTPHLKGSGVLSYDDGVLSGTAAWRLTAHEQGGYIDYSSTSTIVGSAAFSPKILKYRLSGRTLTFTWYFAGTSNSVATTFTLSFTSAVVTSGSYQGLAGITIDNGAYTATPGQVVVGSGSSTVQLSAALSSAGSNWTASGTKTSAGTFSIDVQ